MSGESLGPGSRWTRDHDDNDDDRNDSEDDMDEPQTKKQLYQFYAGRGPAAMVLDLLNDTYLQHDCIIISEVSGPLEVAWGKSLKMMKDSPGKQQIFASQRARNMKLDIVMECLMKIHDDSLLDKLGMTPASTDATLDSLTTDGSNVDPFEKVLMERVSRFAFQLGSEVLWSHAHFFWTLPHAIALYLSPKESERKSSCKHLLHMARAIVKAENDPRLNTCLLDVAWHKEQLPRKILQHGLKCEFDCNNPELRRFAAALFSSTVSTKEILESCFNSMNRQIGYMNTNKRSSHAMKWLLATLNPLLRDYCFQQFLPTEADFYQALCSPAGKRALNFELEKWFDVGATSLPECAPERIVDIEHVPDSGPLSATAILKNMSWKPAGSAATQRSAAATAYICGESYNDFANVNSAWVGAQNLFNNSFCKFLLYFTGPI